MEAAESWKEAFRVLKIGCKNTIALPFTSIPGLPGLQHGPTGSTFSCVAAHGGPPKHITEAWQNEPWTNLSMHPVENSHQSGLCHLSSHQHEEFPRPGPCPRGRTAAHFTTDEPVSKMSASGVSRYIENDNSVGIETL